MSKKFIIESAPGVRAIVNGKDMLYFAGTSYFQYHSHPEVKQAAIDATAKYGTGSASSRTISGTSDLLLTLEKSLASFFDADDAAYIPSGYLVNMAGLQALNKHDTFDVIFVDEQSHYSMMDAVNVVGKEIHLFQHGNIGHLQDLLRKNLADGQRPLIASDGVFPVWVDYAPLPDFVQLAEEFNGVIWIDDAHAVGILGKQRRGTCDHYGIKSSRVFQGATLAKAFGAYGGVIAGEKNFISDIKSGNILTGSSAPMAAAIAAGLKGVELIKKDVALIEKLKSNTKRLKEGLIDLNINIKTGEFPVATFSLESTERMQQVQQKLMESNLFIQYMNYKGAGSNGVLRIVVSALHTNKHIDLLLRAIKQALK